jgi:Polyketide cyclase / dehydrase and lipid transport
VNTILEFEHTVIADAARESAWSFWSDVRNWGFDPSIEWITLDGPFRAGASGVTKPRGKEPTGWRLVEVRPGEGASIEVDVPGAAARFQWRFEDAGAGRTRLTQHVVAEGPGVAEFTDEMRESFVREVQEGMAALASRMAEAARAEGDGG